ncbi:MAG: hypothetical protein JJU02_16735 [Cryomorphaceae bacterium]|nr:hypothetical protein [Cryomorphaceae bacterium]
MDYKTTLLFGFLFFHFSLLGQRPEPYLMTEAFYDAEVYAKKLNWDLSEVNLYADIFEPEREGDILRPLIIMVPDAYFTLSRESLEALDETAHYLASCGYVVASIQYRQGMDHDANKLLEDEFVRAMARSVQDIYSAIDYFREDALRGANSYQINADKVLLLGYSSGGIAALHAGKYYLENNTTARIRRLIAEVGGWGETERKETIRKSIRGVAVIAGGVLDTLMYAPQDRTPVLKIAGEADSIIPPWYGDMIVAGLPLGPFFGPYSVNQQMKSRQKRIEFLLLEDTDHTLNNFSQLEIITPVVAEFFVEALEMLPSGKNYERPPSSILTRETNERRNRILVNLPKDWVKPVSLRVINGSNEEVFRKTEVFPDDEIPVEGWLPGTYMFKFTYGNKLKVVRYTVN